MPSGFTHLLLPITTPLLEPHPYRLDTNSTSPRRRLVARPLLAPGRPLPSSLLQPGTWTLTLERPLKDYSQRPSKMSSGIWTARVGDSDGSQNTECDSRPIVVVKFIQPSLLPYPDAELDSGSSNFQYSEEYESPDWIARLEAASYDHLDRLQGDVIPYFFGKDIVRSRRVSISDSSLNSAFYVFPPRWRLPVAKKHGPW